MRYGRPIGDRYVQSETDMPVETHQRPTCLWRPNGDQKMTETDHRFKYAIFTRTRSSEYILCTVYV